MDRISPLAWTIIFIFGLFIVGLNYGLISALKDGKMFQMPKIRPSRADETLKQAGETLRDPFGKEKRQLDELASLVHRLKETPDLSPSAEPEVVPDQENKQ